MAGMRGVESDIPKRPILSAWSVFRSYRSVMGWALFDKLREQRVRSTRDPVERSPLDANLDRPKLPRPVRWLRALRRFFYRGGTRSSAAGLSVSQVI